MSEGSEPWSFKKALLESLRGLKRQIASIVVLALLSMGGYVLLHPAYLKGALFGMSLALGILQFLIRAVVLLDGSADLDFAGRVKRALIRLPRLLYFDLIVILRSLVFGIPALAIGVGYYFVFRDPEARIHAAQLSQVSKMSVLIVAGLWNLGFSYLYVRYWLVQPAILFTARPAIGLMSDLRDATTSFKWPLFWLYVLINAFSMVLSKIAGESPHLALEIVESCYNALAIVFFALLASVLYRRPVVPWPSFATAEEKSDAVAIGSILTALVFAALFLSMLVSHRANHRNPIGEGKLVALPDLRDPVAVRQEILREGAKKFLIQAKKNEAEWDLLRGQIASGAESWLAVAEALAPAADGAMERSLNQALSRALAKNPYGVLKFLSNNRDFTPDKVCSAIDDVPQTGRIPYFEERLKAVESVKAPAIRAAINECRDSILIALSRLRNHVM